jgi:hypothetical protein
MAREWRTLGDLRIAGIISDKMISRRGGEIIFRGLCLVDEITEKKGRGVLRPKGKTGE